MQFRVSGPPGTQALGIMGTQAELGQLLSECVCCGGVGVVFGFLFKDHFHLKTSFHGL